MEYPGRVIRLGETDVGVLTELTSALNQQLVLQGEEVLVLDPEHPVFGLELKRAVKLFQSRHVDADGVPLRSDGEVGPITWAVLFGMQSVPAAAQSGDLLLSEVLEIAAGEEAKRVREQPMNSNRGPEVDEYLLRAGVSPGLAWCCAFVYWCFDEAAGRLQRDNPMVRTAGCLDHWNRAPSRGARRIIRHQAVADPGLLCPGMVFIIDHGQGKGHTGLVESVGGGYITTIEGNTDASLTREGGGVYRLSRKIVDINKGFIDYGGL